MSEQKLLAGRTLIDGAGVIPPAGAADDGRIKGLEVPDKRLGKEGKNAP
jgi:hypothetical protein